MTKRHEQRVEVALPADVHQVDETGYVWSVLEEASDPSRIAQGRVIVAGDPDEPFLARVVDIVEGAHGTHIVHLGPVGGGSADRMAVSAPHQAHRWAQTGADRATTASRDQCPGTRSRFADEGRRGPIA